MGKNSKTFTKKRGLTWDEQELQELDRQKHYIAFNFDCVQCMVENNLSHLIVSYGGLACSYGHLYTIDMELGLLEIIFKTKKGHEYHCSQDFKGGSIFLSTGMILDFETPTLEDLARKIKQVNDLAWAG